MWWQLDRDADTRHGGLSAGDLLKWRWLCSTGVYHASGNTLSLEILDRIAQSGEVQLDVTNVTPSHVLSLVRVGCTRAALSSIRYSVRALTY